MKENIRVIQYLGSKLQILDDIYEEIETLLPENSIVCDLFSGSGTVSYKLASKYTVYANDVQEYSKVITGVLLQVGRTMRTKIPDINCIFDSDEYKKNKKYLNDMFFDPLKYEREVLNNTDYKALAELCELNLFYDGTNIKEGRILRAKEIFGKSYKCFTKEFINTAKNNSDNYCLFSLYFLNSYFSLEQCIEIDSIKYAIDRMYEKGTIDEYVNNLFLSCLIHSVSEVVSSVGKNFAQPIKVVDKNGDIKSFAIRRCMRDRKLKLKDYMESMYDRLSKLDELHKTNKVFCMNSFEALNLEEMNNVALFYLDPPYTIDHYSRFYHVLETLVRYDYPELEKKKINGKIMILNGRYRDDRFQSNFCIPSKGYTEFEELIKKIQSLGAKIVLSYSDNDCEKDTRKRVVSKDELVDILKKYYSSVCVKTLDHRYRKLSAKNDNRKEMSNGELLIICK